jgi:hypothetical protein
VPVPLRPAARRGPARVAGPIQVASLSGSLCASVFHGCAETRAARYDILRLCVKSDIYLYGYCYITAKTRSTGTNNKSSFCHGIIMGIIRVRVDSEPEPELVTASVGDFPRP